MSFALAVNNLLDALKKTGCPICRIERLAAERALESFLWENVNEPDVRQGILDAYGFCPQHSRVMVAREMMTSSIPLGTNIIYEHLGRVVAGELKELRPGRRPVAPAGLLRRWRAGLHNLLARMRSNEVAQGPLYPRETCPACTAGGNGAANSLHVLCEELQKDGDVRVAYLQSDGVCLRHTREAIQRHSQPFPQAVTLLVDDAVQRLEAQSRGMTEFIRKNNWSYRDEKITEAEDTAWRKTLGFFTGLPGELFIYKVDD